MSQRWDEPGERRILAAMATLSAFVQERAELTAEGAGFGWRTAPDAPDNYEALVVEFNECLVSGRDLRVNATNNSPSIFMTSEANAAMRFWHDVSHVEFQQDFGFKAEMLLAHYHLASLVVAGQPTGSLAWQLLRADTIGQNYVYFLTGGGFVADQVDFAYKALRHGLPFAVLDAVEQIEGRAVQSADMDRLAAMVEQEVTA
jgi:hypothetical protein